MRKRMIRKSSELEATPLLMAHPPQDFTQPKPFIFSSRPSAFSFANATSSSSSSFAKNIKPTASISALISAPPSASAPTHKPPSNIADLRNLASSCLDDLKRHLDRSHSEIFKDLEASHSRFHKRFKIHNQACQQVSDEAEKEHKKILEQINESWEDMKDSYAEFTADAQATASRVCKILIPELSQSLEKAIDGVQRRFGIAAGFE